jgi:hypothetical protein
MAEHDASGGGLPALERFYLNAMLKIACKVWSDSRALASFQLASEQLLSLIDEIDLDLASQQVLIPRLQGIEDASCHWSVLMVCDHLNRVNREIITIMRSLCSNRLPPDGVSIGEFEPDPNVGAEVIAEFRQTVEEFWAFVTAYKPLRSALRHPHPWFGNLDAHDWNCVAAIHQQIHRRQARKIVAVAGIV